MKAQNLHKMKNQENFGSRVFLFGFLFCVCFLVVLGWGFWFG